jgi:hypothetical protein
MRTFKVFKPLKQKLLKRNIFGFDIETYDNNKKFLCASIYDVQNHKVYFFHDKDKLIKFLDDKMFNKSYIVSTNLQFDFFGLFHNKPQIKNYKLVFRKSSFLSAKNIKKHHDIIFIDTLNFAQMSVRSLGEIIGIPKLEKPEFLGEIPKSESEWNYLRKYNINDSRISATFFKFFVDVSQKIGATVKTTIASSAMHLFRNKYLNESYIIHKKEVLIELFNAYYGGRCEVFQRGIFYNDDPDERSLKYFDINSLYPSAMIEEYPDPNSLNINRKNTVTYINNYDGVADVDIYCPPDIKIPILPVRQEKLIFPTGNISGYYSNVELKKAVSLGYVITKVRKNFYYTKKCRPFAQYVNDLYSLRLKYKKENNPAEKIIKLYMNSLYGKFGQKFTDSDKLVHESQVSLEMLENNNKIERVGEYFRFTQSNEPAVFCIPIWALYTSAYGRLKLYDYLTNNDPIYCDTDSIITRNEIPVSDKLGEMKLECDIDYTIIVKPKFYYVRTKEKEMIKIKGVKSVLNSKGKKLDYDKFVDIIKNRKIMFEKFIKFKESLRRKKIPNEIIDFTKEIDSEDDKRIWTESFSLINIQKSKPKNI